MVDGTAVTRKAGENDTESTDVTAHLYFAWRGHTMAYGTSTRDLNLNVRREQHEGVE